jgi:hypothetical protein
VEYGAGGLPAHYEALAIRVLGLPASRHLLDAMFDGGRPAVFSGIDSCLTVCNRSLHQGRCCDDAWVL